MVENENKTNQANEKDYVMIPYFTHEADMARSERNSKRQWIAIIVLIISLLVSNVAWIIYESQFVTVSDSEEYNVSQNADNEGQNLILFSEGELNYGN